MEYGNYVAPIVTGRSLHDTFMQNLKQQTDIILRNQAAKKQSVIASEPKGLYGFDTSGWSKEYKDAFLRLQEHAINKHAAGNMADGELAITAQKLLNLHGTIDNMWKANRDGMNTYIGAVSSEGRDRYDTESTFVSELPETVNQKIEYANNWGTKNISEDPNNYDIQIQAVDPSGRPLFDNNFFSVGEHPYAGYNANNTIWNWEMSDKVTYTPEEIANDLQDTVDRLIQDGKSMSVIKRDILDLVARNSESKAYGRSPGVYLDSMNITPTGDESESTIFAKEVWKFISQTIDEGSGRSRSGSGGGAGAELVPEMSITSDRDGQKRISIFNYPREGERTINIGKWIERNFDRVNSALIEAGVPPEKAKAGVMIEDIKYNTENGVVTLVNPSVPVGNTSEVIGIDVELDPADDDYRSIITRIERNLNNLFNTNCTIQDFAEGTCAGFENATTSDTNVGAWENINPSE